MEPDSTARFTQRALVKMKERAKALLSKNKNELPAAHTLYVSLDRADNVIEGGLPSCGRPASRSEGDLLVRLPLVMAAHFDLHFLVQALQKVEQLVCGEAAEMTVHQV